MSVDGSRTFPCRIPGFCGPNSPARHLTKGGPTVDPTLATPRANFDFYDRTGSIIHNVIFDAVP